VPHLREKDRQDEQRADTGHDVHQRGIHVVRPEELDRAEGDAAEEKAGPDGQRLSRVRHHPHQPEGQDQGGERQDAARHRAELHFGQTGDRTQGSYGVAQASERHGGRVGEQAEHRGLEWGEAEPDHHRGSDGDGSARAARSLQQRPEGESDQQQLEP
jgi:hypothetical protein